MEKRGADGHPLRSVTAAAAATHRTAATAAREELAGWGFGSGMIRPRVASWSRRRGAIKICCCLFQCQTLVASWSRRRGAIKTFVVFFCSGRSMRGCA